jgi:hypothetical protein
MAKRRRPKPHAKTDQLATLAVELALAAGELLREDYYWSPQSISVFLEKMLSRAQKNRKVSLDTIRVLQAARVEKKAGVRGQNPPGS